jgi:hypothetical protein
MAIVGLDPTSGPIGNDDESRQLARRPLSLGGQVIGLVANGLGQGEAMLAALYEELAEFDTVEGAISVRKSSVSIPPDPDDWKRLTEGATVAITGFGG